MSCNQRLEGVNQPFTSIVDCIIKVEYFCIMQCANWSTCNIIFRTFKQQSHDEFLSMIPYELVVQLLLMLETLMINKDQQMGIPCFRDPEKCREPEQSCRCWEAQQAEVPAQPSSSAVSYPRQCPLPLQQTPARRTQQTKEEHFRSPSMQKRGHQKAIPKFRIFHQNHNL